MNVLILTVTIALAGVPPASASRSSRGGVPAGEVREQIETFLGAIHMAVTPEQWQALGPDAAPVLMEIASSREHLPTRRSRAVQALGMRRDAAASALVNKLVADPAEPRTVRMSAARAVTQLSKDVEAQAVLTPLLQDKDLHLRAAVASALASTGAGGCRLVAQRLQRETGEERALMERNTASCRKP